MTVNLELIKKLRDLTSASINDCLKALTEANQDIDKALQLLRQRGLEIALKKKDRPAQEGRIEAYVHLGNKIGVLLEVNCETDFVARNEDFCRFTRDLALQIAAQAPIYINKEEIPQDELQKHQDNLEDYLKSSCLMGQPFIKNPNISIKDYLADIVAKINENIVIRRFVRYKLGE